MKDRHQDPPAGGTEETQALGTPHSGITDDRLLDYLYDELDEADRANFERELRADPSLMREVEEHRRTRQSFAYLLADPMPAGLLDGVLEAADAQAATFAAAESPKPGWWQRMVEGLKGLVFQPAFAMGFVFLLVGGIALYSSRDPKEMAGMGPPIDVQRLPPVAMAPAGDQAVEGERSKNEAAPLAEAAAASATLRLEDEPSDGVADQLAQGYLRSGEAGIEQPAPSVTRHNASRLLDKSASAGGADWDKGAAQPDPVIAALAEADGRFKEAEAKPSTKVGSSATSTTKSTAGPKTDDAAPGRGQAGATTGDSAQGYGEPRPQPPAVSDARRAPKMAREAKASPAAPIDTFGSEGVADDEAGRQAGAKKIEEGRNSEEEVALAHEESSERSRDSDVAKQSPQPDAQNVKAPPNKRTTDELAKDAPSALPMKTEIAATPAKPAAPTTPAPPTPERLWSTLGQQMAAGALADAQRTLSELVKVEGESARVKAARDELAKAMAKSPPKPADTRPVPEPAKTTP